MTKKFLINALLMILPSIFLLIIGEIIFRYVDSYAIFSARLQHVDRSLKSILKKTNANEITFPSDFRADFLNIHSVDGVFKIPTKWFYEDPVIEKMEAITTKEIDTVLLQRLEKYPTDPYGATFVWNREYLKNALCRESKSGSMGILEDFFYFTPKNGTMYPYYRQMSLLNMPGKFKTNSFGWRSRDIKILKDKNTIRIAFVGASTTVNSDLEKFSYPEYVENWLNMWVKKNFPR